MIPASRRSSARRTGSCADSSPASYELAPDLGPRRVARRVEVDDASVFEEELELGLGQRALATVAGAFGGAAAGPCDGRRPPRQFAACDLHADHGVQLA